MARAGAEVPESRNGPREPPAPGFGAGAVAVGLPGGQALIIGGSAPGAVVRPTTRSYLYSRGQWATAELGAARTSHTATALKDGHVLVTGGFQSAQVQALRTAELFDPASGVFAPTGEMVVGRANHAAALLPDGRVTIVGGGRTGKLGSCPAPSCMTRLDGRSPRDPTMARGRSSRRCRSSMAAC